MPPDGALHVACAAEGEYVRHGAAMLHSVLAQHPEGVRVHYLHGPDVTGRARRALADMVEANGGAISFHDFPDARLEGLPTRGFTRKATWYRIFLPETLGDLERILYLDSDLIAVDSLRPLWETDLTGHWVGAVTNVLMPWHRHRPAELGLDPRSYFNAGVMLMNLQEMRRDGCTRALLDYSRRRAPELEWRDQDAVNAVLGGRRLHLHPRWNCMNAVMNFDGAEEVFGAEAVAEARRDPAVRHFEGPTSNKPWHYECERGLRELYFRHRRQTPWPRARIEGRTPRTVWRRWRDRLSPAGG